jgi:hypothetical protein
MGNAALIIENRDYRRAGIEILGNLGEDLWSVIARREDFDD